ncbi:50S ribosomal protein L24 [Tuwongella immobilis]|uniref:Large ribosomal subunit protein uL24 n=1 Tax=Tuwongella immobilis TaxID=692036 RepID=A0A6C2YXI6_9BACT|nr:50S ribosomal protein L24 [Tuwongella immobilis]VIP05495.1 50s ribosomal protein l24 : 50S ribosomal protein L24 OS=Rhodopirellula maiorica SM1 GN=rplX PE=3 SV=1 [Tuwongella immobilis]VTS08346.1 50s ribosomal protein l24 : 50S ribosomal protein L24 OS=Rhodopirellula maiorica SM1 GN=rplX PE=3 SV=1 [Tuwongella immobilis]
MHIRTGDIVAIISGESAGLRRKVLRVDPKNNKIVVEGVHVVKKHVRPDRRNPRGGVIEKEMPIDASKAMLIDPQTQQPTRVGVRYREDGTKELYAKKSGMTIRVLSRPRPSYAKPAQS